MLSPKADKGVVRFVDSQTFEDHAHGLGEADFSERVLAGLLGQGEQNLGIGDWPRIDKAIRRDGLFVIQASRPGFEEIFLTFNPDRLETGEYRIRYQPHGASKQGRTLKAVAIPADATDFLLSALKPFPDRWAVVTISSQLNARKVWLVGLSDYELIEQTS